MKIILREGPLDGFSFNCPEQIEQIWFSINDKPVFYWHGGQPGEPDSHNPAIAFLIYQPNASSGFPFCLDDTDSAT